MLVVVALAAVVAAVGIAGALDDTRGGAPPAARPTVTATAQTEPPAPTTDPDPDPGATSLPRPGGGELGGDATTRSPRGTGANEPPGPVRALGDNPLFRDGLGLAPVACVLPRFSANVEAQAAYYRAAVRCLDEAWLPVLRAAGLPATSPRLEVPTAAFTTLCGNKPADAAANYCEGTIFMPARYFAEVEQLPTDRPTRYLAVLAHEYGHHVQELAGVMDAAWDRRYEAGVNSPEGLDVSRRNELLASCFGGMFYAATVGRGSVTRAMLDDAADDQARRGDHPETGQARDHGTPAHNGSWFLQGVRLNRTFQCNTWLAPADAVS